MSIEINLIPEEFKPKPLIQTQTLIILIIVLVMGYGCYYFYSGKAGDEAEASDTENRITEIRGDIAALENDPEIKELQKEIAELQADKSKYTGLNTDYDTFTESRIEWGYVINSIRVGEPWGVDIESITQSGNDNKVTVSGTASNYDRVTVYVAQLEGDVRFSNVKTMSWEAGSGIFSLSFTVESGGGA